MAPAVRNYAVRQTLILKPNQSQNIWLLAALLTCLPAVDIMANGLALPDQDAFATARGEAVVATADNASAVYYNPAGITQLEGLYVRGGAYLLSYHPGFQPPAGKANSGQTYNEQDNFAAAPRMFATYTPTNSPLSFGLGVYAPFGGNMSWPDNTGFYSVASSGKLTYVTINPVVAWKVLPSLSVAAGPMVNYADLTTQQGLYNFTPGISDFYHFNGNGWSAGYNLGLRWQPLEQLSFGGTLRSSSRVKLQGQTDFEYQSFRIPYSSRSANMDLNFPMTAVLGVSYRPTPKWNFEFDANYTDWSSFGSTAIIYQSSLPPFPMNKPNVPVTFDWQPSWMYEFGVTRYFENGWSVSAGYCFNQNSVPNSYYSPLAADMDRQFVSFGTGWKGRHLEFDVAYQFGFAPDHTVTGSSPSSTPARISGENADGTYSFYSHAISLSLGWHF